MKTQRFEMSSPRLTHALLICLIALTLIGFVFHFTLAVGCVPGSANHYANCPMDRQNQSLSAVPSLEAPILNLILPIAPVILLTAAILLTAGERSLQKRLILVQNIPHPPILLTSH